MGDRLLHTPEDGSSQSIIMCGSSHANRLAKAPRSTYTLRWWTCALEAGHNLLFFFKLSIFLDYSLI